MQQFTRKPVTVYRWDDTDAPQIGYQTPGEFKTVLKACLNTGYGSKQSLGWEIVDEDTNRIAVRSADPNSTQSVLYIDDSHGTTAMIRAYESMSDLDTGVGKFEYRYHENLRFYPVTSSSAGSQQKWIIVGHDTAFVIVSWNGSASYNSNYFLFGDFPSFKPGDQYNCALLAWMTDQRTGNDVPFSVGFSSSNTHNFWCGALSRSADQLTKTTSGIAVNSIAPSGGYPDSISGGWVGGLAYIKEGTSYRGIAPGLIVCNSITTATDFDFATNFPQSTDTSNRHIWVNQVPYSGRLGFVINTTQWLAP